MTKVLKVWLKDGLNMLLCSPLDNKRVWSSLWHCIKEIMKHLDDKPHLEIELNLRHRLQHTKFFKNFIKNTDMLTTLKEVGWFWSITVTEATQGQYTDCNLQCPNLSAIVRHLKEVDV